MENALIPTGDASGSKPTLPHEYSLSVSLNNYRHTYGDAVRGLVTLRLPESAGLELLEMKFTGTCGTGIKRSSKDSPSSPRIQEEKNLFTHTQTLVSERLAKPGTHKFSYSFRFPRRDEVVLAPSIEPLASDNYFFFRYEITATAEIQDGNGQIRVLHASRTPDFMSSRESIVPESSDYTRIAVPAEPQNFVKNTVLGRRSSSVSIDDGQERIIASLLAPRIIQTKENMDMPISLRMENYKQHRSTRYARLSKITLYLRSRIRLTAQGQSVTMDSLGNQPIQIASANLRKSSPLCTLTRDREVNMDCKFPLRAPHYLRSSFVNDLIAYEYLLKVKVEFDVDGRHFIARFDHIPVALLPSFTQPDHDEWDYTSSPPELEDEYADGFFFGTPPSSLPATPPPEFSEFPDEDIERRFRPCVRQHSTSSSVYASSLWDIPADPPKYEAS